MSFSSSNWLSVFTVRDRRGLTLYQCRFCAVPATGLLYDMCQLMRKQAPAIRKSLVRSGSHQTRHCFLLCRHARLRLAPIERAVASVCTRAREKS